MDTKSRKFSRTRGVKALLLIMYIACFAAIGAITGFVPAYGYMDYGVNGFNAMFADSAENTSIFKNALREKELLLMNSDIKSSDDLQMLTRNADFYIRIKTVNGKLYESGIEPYWQLEYTRTNGGEFIGIGYQNVIISGNPTVKEFSIGMDRNEYFYLENSWRQVRHNMWVVCVSDILLLAVGILLLCALCRVSGERSDGTVSLHPFFMLPYELSLGLLFMTFFLAVNLIASLHFQTDWNKAFKTLFMVCFGGFADLIALLLLYFFTSIGVRGKNKRLAGGSIIACLTMGVWKLLKWCGRYIRRFFRFLKEIITGELFKGSAAKKLIIIDLIFIIITSFNIIFAIVFYFAAALWVILEILALALFLFGRYILIRDAAVLERQIKEMYNGNYAYSEPLRKNSPYTESSEMLCKLASQYRKGIEESVRAERMKIDLVTNVSHDLKTPLTSIISYVELLSREELPPAARDYVTILQQKSTRLKNIVADVFELAKTTSGEIAVANEQLDLNKLSYQTLAEMEDKISRSGFIVKANICEPPVTVMSDGKRIYRIIQNLMDNALKYSLSGTRIYYALEKNDGKAIITIKNIASYEMNFTTEEILERFARGDKSRTTEGSGLGLSIAQGFALACGGDFKIEIDGDMFKSIITFPLYNAGSEAPDTDTNHKLNAATEDIVLPLSPAPEDEEENISDMPAEAEESNVEAADSAKQPETESSEPTELEEIKADELLKETVNTDE